jgi:hypothetical protein
MSEAIVSSNDESTADEPQRIDLTQFERMISGPWRIEWIPGADTENEEPSAAIQAEDYGTIAQTFYRDWDKPYEATTKAIAAVPELLAELKRCYEELDKWTEYATYVENVNMDCHQDACAEAGFLWKCTDCGAHFELPGDGIYKCEFGCDASE